MVFDIVGFLNHWPGVRVTPGAPFLNIKYPCQSKKTHSILEETAK